MTWLVDNQDGCKKTSDKICKIMYIVWSIVLKTYKT